jgi:hypothetical protein
MGEKRIFFRFHVGNPEEIILLGRFRNTKTGNIKMVLK